MKTRRHFSSATIALLSALWLAVPAVQAATPGNPLSPAAQPDAPAVELIRTAPLSDKLLASADAKRARFPVVVPFLRSRSVALDLAGLEALREPIASGTTSRRVNMSFFDDVSLPVELNRVERTSSGGYAYSGFVPGAQHSVAVLVNNDGVVSMSVNLIGKSYNVTGSAKDGYEVRELAAIDRPDHGQPPIEIGAPSVRELQARAGARSSEGQGDRETVAADTGAEIDVMVVYTPRGRTDNGGTSQMNANVDAQVALTNTIYANSNVVQRLRLVYKGEVNHVEDASSSTDLGRLRSTNDGVIDVVHTLRDLYRADLVSLWGYYPDTCGIGYLMQTETSGFASSGFNIVNSPACTALNSYTFAHELGHNMGLRHDNYEDGGTTSVTPEAGGMATTITYAHGYVDLANRFRTVLAYNDQCVAQVPAFNCTRIPYFSNPSVNYLNSAYGSAVLAPTGNAATAHERQALNDTRETVANFRQALATLTGPGALIFQAPSYTVSEGAGSVQIEVSRHLGSTGAVSVGYSTANGTAIAGADFTSTSGTLNWADGDTAIKTITIPILQDSAFEGNETFTVTINNPTGGATVGAAQGTSTSVTVTINDDDADNWPPACALPSGWVVPAGATGGWSVATDSVFGATCSLKSDAIATPANGTSPAVNRAQIQFTGNFQAGNITFARRVSSEAGWDCLRFYIDGNPQVITPTASACLGGSTQTGISGDVAWASISVPITAGTHILTWSYEKDEFVSGADAAWIDSLTLPLVPVALTVAKSGTGSGTVTGTGISCGADCSESVAPGTVVTLTAAPAGGSIFSGWSGGGCSGTGNCVVTVNAATSVTATFTQNDFMLTIAKAGAGSGTVTSNPAGINCGVSCAASFSSTTSITLTALPAMGSSFAGWSGGGCTGTSTCTLSIAAATTVTATFTSNPVAPAAPTIVSATAGNSLAVVTFNAPSADGGSPITGYTVSCDPGGVPVTANGAASPIMVSGLTNGVTYACSVQAINAIGTGAASATLNVTPAAGALALVSARSVKNHGAPGDFTIAINTAAAIGGNITVEPRSIGAGHIIVLTFSGAVTSVSGATVVDAASTALPNPSISFAGNEITLVANGIPDNRRLTFTVSGINGSSSASIAVGFLVGDVNDTRTVNASDISAVKAHMNQTTNGTNFRFDLNATGSVTANDVSAVKARSGLSMP